MDPAEEAALATGLADLSPLLSPLLSSLVAATEPELEAQLRALAKARLLALVKQLSRADPLRRRAKTQARATSELEARHIEALAHSSKPDFDFSSLVAATASVRLSQTEEEQILKQRTSEYRLGVHHALPTIQSELVQSRDDYADAAKHMADFFGTTKGLWDKEPSTWRAINWKNLEEAATMAKEWPEIQDLARRLGRQWSSDLAGADPSSDPPVIERQTSRHEHHEVLGRSQIAGLTQGRDLSLLPAMEIALLADSDTDTLFLKRHAEGHLANFEYITQAHWFEQHETTRLALAPPPKSRDQGPVIICVDSSGSMTGMPERVAKALCLALIRACHDSSRGCYLIAFSTNIQCLDLSDPLARLEGLLDFMAHAFRGGTDLRPALYKSLELLDTPEWKNSDLLIISDFRIPKLMIKKSNLIEPIRTRHAARLHALSITADLPVDDLHIFDTRWHFKIGSTGEPLGMHSSQFREL